MAKPKSVTITLTDKQRTQLRALTGENHKEVTFEATRGGKLAPKLATRLAARTVGRTVSPATRIHSGPFPKFTPDLP